MSQRVSNGDSNMVNKTELTEKEIWREIRRDTTKRNKSNKVIFSYIKKIPFISLFNKLSVNFWGIFNVVSLFLSFYVSLKVVSIIPISGIFQLFLIIVYGLFISYIVVKWAYNTQDMTHYIKKVRRLENIYRIRESRKQ